MIELVEADQSEECQKHRALVNELHAVIQKQGVSTEDAMAAAAELLGIVSINTHANCKDAQRAVMEISADVMDFIGVNWSMVVASRVAAGHPSTRSH